MREWRGFFFLSSIICVNLVSRNSRDSGKRSLPLQESRTGVLGWSPDLDFRFSLLGGGRSAGGLKHPPLRFWRNGRLFGGRWRVQIGGRDAQIVFGVSFFAVLGVCFGGG